MRTKRKWTSPEDELAGIFPNLQRGPGGIPLPPQGGGTTPPPATGGGTTNGSPGGSGTGPRKPGSGYKPAGAGGASSSSSSSSGASTYQDYINAQKKAASKASNKAANSSIQNAEALRAQANALLVLLGKEPGGGPNPFAVGGGGGGGGKSDGRGSGSIRGNVNWQGGTGWKPDGSGPKKPGDQTGVRTGTDVKPLPGQPPKFPGGGGGKDPATNMPRTAAGGKWRGEEGQTGPGNVRDTGKNGGKDKPGGWGDDWKDHYPGGKGGKGGNGKGGNGKDGGRGGRNLDNDGLAGELKTNLRNVERAMKTADDLLMSQYDERVTELGKAAGDNDKAVNAQGFANQTNRGRERMNAVSELISHGAGETDALRAQGMSLRNFEQNQLDVNRSFFDTLTTINSSLKDTTIDTRTARVQNKQEAIDDKQQLWNSYFDASSEAYTNLGNTYGAMATEYRNADSELDGKKGKKAARRAKRLGRKSAAAFMDAADFGKRSKKTPEVADDLMDWKGADSFEGNMNNSTYRGGAGVAMDRAEGATLRKWNA